MRPGLGVLAACVVGGVYGPAQAAQTYVQPQADVRVETNSNIDLDPDGSPDGSVHGYIADLQALIGIATQRSETSLRPRIRLQEYPDRDQRERVEGFVDLVSRYDWERSKFDVVAKWSQQDSYNFDTRGGEFDDLDPNDPSPQRSGRALLGETRTSFEFRPDYLYEATERVSFGVGGEWQSTRYDAEAGDPQDVDFDFVLGDAEVRWRLDPRSSIRAGGYFSNYDPKEGAGESDSYGVSLGYLRDWTERAGFEVIALYETNSPKFSQADGGGDRSSGFGGLVSGFYKGELSTWRLSAGHTYTPGNDGKMEQSDRIRLQYNRKLSERLSMMSAARYESDENLTSGSAANDEATARFDLNLNWLLSRTWYVTGGYSYVWMDRESDESSADNNRFFIGAGYRGLGKQGR